MKNKGTREREREKERERESKFFRHPAMLEFCWTSTCSRILQAPEGKQVLC